VVDAKRRDDSPLCLEPSLCPPSLCSRQRPPSRHWPLFERLRHWRQAVLAVPAQHHHQHQGLAVREKDSRGSAGPIRLDDPPKLQFVSSVAGLRLTSFGKLSRVAGGGQVVDPCRRSVTQTAHHTVELGNSSREEREEAKQCCFAARTLKQGAKHVRGYLTHPALASSRSRRYQLTPKQKQRPKHAHQVGNPTLAQQAP
jgi:hypothetical protein